MAWWKLWSDDDGVDDEPDYYEEGVHLARQERYHEALTSFRLALREEPENRAALEQMAVVYTRIGMSDEAIRVYRRVLEQAPGSPPAHYGLAFLLLRRDRSEEAAEHLEAFLEAPPEGPDSEEHVRHARETLRRLEAGGERPPPPAGAGPATEGPPPGPPDATGVPDPEDGPGDGP